MSAPARPYGVTVEAARPYYPDNGDVWWTEIYGFAEATLEEAQARGERAAANLAPGRLRTRYTVHQICAACGLTGKAPGCKRKPCPVCDGTLRLPHVVFDGG